MKNEERKQLLKCVNQILFETGIQWSSDHYQLGNRYHSIIWLKNFIKH